MMLWLSTHKWVWLAGCGLEGCLRTFVFINLLRDLLRSAKLGCFPSKSHVSVWAYVFIWYEEAFHFCKHTSDVQLRATDAVIRHTVVSDRKVFLLHLNWLMPVPADIKNDLSRALIHAKHFGVRMPLEGHLCCFERRYCARGTTWNIKWACHEWM